MDVDVSVNEQVSNAVATILTAGAVAVGGVVNVWLSRWQQRSRDMAAAREKVRALEQRLGMVPAQLETIDDLFAAVRLVGARVDELEKKGPL